MAVRALIVTAVIAAALPALAQEAADKPNTNWRGYQEGDYVVNDYKFASGESLPQLKLHYRTLGTAKRNAAGEIVNGVLLLQGNTGTGANWLRPTLTEELFKDGQPLDAGRYFIIIPDALGRGGSSKPSDGLKGNFPLPLSRHGRQRAPAGHRRAQGDPSAPRHRQFARLHAQFHVGRDVSRLDGRDRRALLPAG